MEILKIDEMRISRKQSNEKYMEGFAKRYPDIFLSKDDEWYNDTVKTLKYRAAQNNGEYNIDNVIKRAKSDIDEYSKRYHKQGGGIKIPKEVLVNFYNMTENNFHVEVRYEIALYLQQYSEDMYEFVSYFNNMLKDENLRSDRFNTAYLLMSDIMMVKIAKIFGDDIANTISDCL